MIRSWRVSQGEPNGLHVWFDPAEEVVRLYSLKGTPEERSEGVDMGSEIPYLDSVVSVSGSEAEARAVSGNQQLDLLDLTDLPQGVMIDHA